MTLLSMRRGGQSRFYHYDGLGSTVQLSDATQAVTDTYVYDSWGNQVNAVQPTTNPFRYVGKQNYYTDQQAQLKLLGVRYYNALTGSLVASDPKRSGGNWYRYASNRPVLFSDPTGLAEFFTLKVDEKNKIMTLTSSLYIRRKNFDPDPPAEWRQALFEYKAGPESVWSTSSHKVRICKKGECEKKDPCECYSIVYRVSYTEPVPVPPPPAYLIITVVNDPSNQLDSTPGTFVWQMEPRRWIAAHELGHKVFKYLKDDYSNDPAFCAAHPDGIMCDPRGRSEVKAYPRHLSRIAIDIGQDYKKNRDYYEPCPKEP